MIFSSNLMILCLGMILTKLLFGLLWSTRIKQCNSVKDQNAISLKIKSSKPKPKEPSSSIMLQDK